MPVYEYKCLDCQKTFEALRRMDQMNEPMECPHCGGAQTKRQLSVFGVASKQSAPCGQAGGSSKPPACGGG